MAAPTTVPSSAQRRSVADSQALGLQNTASWLTTTGAAWASSPTVPMREDQRQEQPHAHACLLGSMYGSPVVTAGHMSTLAEGWRRSEDGDVLFANGIPAGVRYAWVDELGAASEAAFSFWVGRQVESDPDVRMTVPTAGAYEVATERLACFEGAG